MSSVLVVIFKISHSFNFTSGDEEKEATIKEQRYIIYINNKASILKTVNNIMQKTKKSFYNIQRIKERRIKLNLLFLNWKI